MMASSAAAHVQTVRVGEQTLTVRDVQPADRCSVLALHEHVFGPGATPAWFEWKYGSGADQGRSEGVGVWHEGALIAHCAGIPRRLWRAGSSIEGLQIGDVMVDPGWRGILTRRGPFFHASQRLYATRLGKLGQRPFQLGFGFPNERHMRLAVKSHLAYDGGRLHDLRWSTSDPTGQTALHWSWRWEAMAHDDPSTLDEIDRAWLAMRREGAAMTLGERDHRYVKWRYLDRPDQQYQLFRLHHVWPSRKVGIAVMRLRQPQSQWLDWIGPRKWLIAACSACRAQAAQFGAKELAAWASPLVVDALRDSAWRHNSVTACLGIPASSDLIEADVPQLNWWLMGGDTDFL